MLAQACAGPAGRHRWLVHDPETTAFVLCEDNVILGYGEL